MRNRQNDNAMSPACSANGSRDGWRCDGRSFEQIYDDNHQLLVRVAAPLCGPDAAMDIVQEVFVRLFESPDKFVPGRGSLRAYLIVVTRHLAVDGLRSAGSRRAREARSERSEPRYFDTPHDALTKRDEAAAVGVALSGLNPRERQAICLAFYGHLTYRQVAVELSIPEGTAKTRIRRGLRDLHRALRGHTESNLRDTG